MTLELILKDIQDPRLRENFFRLERYIREQTILEPDFEFFEVDVPHGDLLYAVPHGLSYIPTDVILLSVQGNMNCYFRYDKFDKTNIYIGAMGPARLRFLLGRFEAKGKRALEPVKFPFVAPSYGSSSSGGSSSVGGSGSDGWAFIQDSAYPVSTPFNYTTPGSRIIIPNNGLGAGSNYTNAPADASNWWEASAAKFHPNANGDFYEFKLNMTIIPALANKSATVDYDIGTAALPFMQTYALSEGAGTPQKFSIAMPAPIGPAPFANGIRFGFTASCNCQIYGINLTIVRVFKK